MGTKRKQRTFRHCCCSLDGIRETMAVEIRGTGSIHTGKKLWKTGSWSRWLRRQMYGFGERTGICRRHIAEKETVVDMGVQAAMQALEHSGFQQREIDLLIVSTLSAETVMPSVSCRIQERIGAVRAVCFDLNAACSGFYWHIRVQKHIWKTELTKQP